MYVIGYLDDQAYMGRSVILTSVINDVPQAYNAIMKDYFSKRAFDLEKSNLMPGMVFISLRLLDQCTVNKKNKYYIRKLECLHSRSNYEKERDDYESIISQHVIP